jgi:hypothetical protein
VVTPEESETETLRKAVATKPKWWKKPVTPIFAVIFVVLLGVALGAASLWLKFEQLIVAMVAVPTALGAITKVLVEAASPKPASRLDQVGWLLTAVGAVAAAIWAFGSPVVEAAGG